MAIKDSGPLKLRADIGAEVGLDAAQNIFVVSTDAIRGLISKNPNEETRMSEYYGKSSGGGMGCYIFKPVAPPAVAGWNTQPQGYSKDGSGDFVFAVPAGWVFHLVGIKKASTYGFWGNLEIDGIGQADEWQSSSWPKWFASGGSGNGSFAMAIEVHQQIKLTASDGRNTTKIVGVFQQK